MMMEDLIEWHRPERSATDTQMLLKTVHAIPQQFLIYFIPGNPGLIEYYRSFSDQLSKKLESPATDTWYHFLGRSLAGYNVSTTAEDHDLPLSLEGQIDHVESQIIASARRDQELQRKSCEDAFLIAPPPVQVVLVGHSVGTYIILQAIARRQTQQRDQSGNVERLFELAGAICLFPTIVDIAKSPSGKKVHYVATSTYLAPTLQYVAKLLCAVCSPETIAKIVQLITGQSEGAAKTTAAFIGSRHGVLQALFMGRHELLEMTHDKWSDDLWTGPAPSNANDIGQHSAIVGGSHRTADVKIDRPKLYFYWGENDHWIDNSTRDRVIATRARSGSSADDDGKPHMEIDTLGTPHDFCISDEHSEVVAEKVAGYVRDITERRRVRIS